MAKNLFFLMFCQYTVKWKRAITHSYVDQGHSCFACVLPIEFLTFDIISDILKYEWF